MSQRNVERVIGRLVTDEAFRFEFMRNPTATLHSLAAAGIELTQCEVEALQAVDPRMVSFFADTLDPCLQKSDLGGGNK